MSFSRIEIKSKETGGNGSVFTEVFLDGKQIHGVKEIRFENSVNDRLPIVTIDLVGLDVSIDSTHFELRHEGFGAIKSIEFEEEQPIEQ